LQPFSISPDSTQIHAFGAAYSDKTVTNEAF